MLSVNETRLRKLLEVSARVGAVHGDVGEGLDRVALSERDMEGRQFITEAMRSAGLNVVVDGALNIHGRLGDWSKPPSREAPAVVVGSHHDTVPSGGRLDGALGVIAGIECLWRIRELGLEIGRPMEVVNFTDEEGRFGGMLGSMCYGGKLSGDDVMGMADVNGIRAAELLARLRGCSSDVDAARDAAASAMGEGSVVYVELHIEQGPVLDNAGEALGVVSGICGLRKYEICLRGEANHAGTTPMAMRKDAYGGAAEFRAKIDEIIAVHGSGTTVCTVGSLTLKPNAANIVPEECIFTTEVRDENASVIQRVAEAIESTLRDVAHSRSLELSTRIMSSIAPVACNKTIVDVIQRNCMAALGSSRPVRVMPSGAAHDAQQINGPMGMIFVPSVAGLSHHPREHTMWEHLVLGSNVLLNTIVQLALSPPPQTPAPYLTAGVRASAAAATEERRDADGKFPAENAKALTALLCIDLQKFPPTTTREGTDFVQEDVESYRSRLVQVVENVRNAQGFARSNGIDVIHCRIKSKTNDGRDRSRLHKRMGIHVKPHGDKRAEFLEGIGPVGDEMIFDKTGSNAFVTTNIAYVLRNANIDRLVVAGVLTDECVAGTVKSACDFGFDCTVLEDACTAATEDRHRSSIMGLRRFATIMNVRDWIGRREISRL